MRKLLREKQMKGMSSIIYFVITWTYCVTRPFILNETFPINLCSKQFLNIKIILSLMVAVSVINYILKNVFILSSSAEV